jgi:hypothetical protein
MPTVASAASLFFLKSSLVETRNIFGGSFICPLGVSSIVIEQGVLTRKFGLFDINLEILFHFIRDELVEHVFTLLHQGFLILIYLASLVENISISKVIISNKDLSLSVDGASFVSSLATL